MFVLYCLFELFSRVKLRTEQNTTVLNNRFADSNIPSCRVHKMGRPITIHSQPLYYCICVCRMYYMYLCLFTVSTISTLYKCILRIQTNTRNRRDEKKTHHRKGIVGKAFSHDVRFSYIVKHVRIIHVHVQCVYGSKNT